MLKALSSLVKYFLVALGSLTLTAIVLLFAVPEFKYKIYKVLPTKLRWEISYALSDKFLVGMVYFVEKDDQILLVKQTYQDKWGLPGGWLNKNETLRESTARELREELGATLEDFEILTIRKVPNGQIIDVAIRGKISGDTMQIGDGEVEKYQFFPRNALPKDVIRTHKAFIVDYLARKGSENTPKPGVLATTAAEEDKK